MGKGVATNDCEQVNHEEEQEPPGRSDQRSQERREKEGTSTPRQKPSWGKRGGCGRVMMISRGSEISIAEGVGEIVRGPSIRSFFFFLYIYHVFVVRYKNSRAALAMV